MEQVRRDAICEACRAGWTSQKIIEFFHYPKSTVYKVVKAFDNGGRTEQLTTAQEQTKSGLQGSWQVSRDPLMLIQTPLSPS
ncbi:Uncharacterized protein FKW44_000964 [Caligus rogercresseyi]|uniref:Uncharacterized protein n=1 Tax=Caligus rogercresseyi TaxID=217165 RepID=A0A7T8QV84_CALRO|nr:Uncharacterized protein FKW44_000964 [Caligus rogercresseyi]